MRLLLATLVVCVATPSMAAPAAPPTPPKPAAPIERRLHSDDIDASSFLWNDWNKFVENYHPNYVADDDPATAWVEGAKGSGKGEWLRIALTPLEKTTHVRLRVRNGYQKSKDLFAANARAKEVKLRLLPSKVEKTVTLADKDGWQDVAIDQPSGMVNGVELTIGSVVEGTKYEDLCISDIQVFATSETPDNPAFEKSKHDTLMKWRAGRIAAAKVFKSAPKSMPIYPAYEVTGTDRESDWQGGLDGTLEGAAKDPAFAKEWKDALATAQAVAKDMDSLPRAQLAPSSTVDLVEADGVQVPRVQDVIYGGLDGDALRLPMLGWVSSLFADQLRMLDVKDATKPSDYVGSSKSCKADMTWVKRAVSKEATGPARVAAVLFGRCGKVEEREGTSYQRTLELYVYDATGRLVLLAGSGHVEGYRWTTDGDKPMLAGGRGLLLGRGRAIEAKKREAVAAK